MAMHFHDLHGHRDLWKTQTIRSSQLVTSRQSGADKAKEYVDAVLEQIDVEYRLTTMPDISAEVAAQRVEQLAASASGIHLRELVEIRFYQASGLIREDTASTIYKALFGLEDGQRFIESNPADRQKIIGKWLSSQ